MVNAPLGLKYNDVYWKLTKADAVIENWSQGDANKDSVIYCCIISLVAFSALFALFPVCEEEKEGYLENRSFIFTVTILSESLLKIFSLIHSSTTSLYEVMRKRKESINIFLHNHPVDRRLSGEIGMEHLIGKKQNKTMLIELLTVDHSELHYTLKLDPRRYFYSHLSFHQLTIIWANIDPKVLSQYQSLLKPQQRLWLKIIEQLCITKLLLSD